MRLWSWGEGALVLFLFGALLLSLSGYTHSRPVSNPQHALENMRQIPQWHCLRYRRFDLVKRCRNHRMVDSRRLHDLNSAESGESAPGTRPLPSPAEKSRKAIPGEK